MLQVVLDTSGLYVTQAGVARYIRGMLRGGEQLGISGISTRQLAWPVENFGYRQPQRALKTFYRDVVWRVFVAPRRLHKLQPDVFHSLSGGYVSPPRSMGWVVTLHDLAALRFPGRYRKWQRLNAYRRAKLALQADRIICISQFTADEAIAMFGVAASKLEVVHNGCDFHPDQPLPTEGVPDFPVPAEFNLFVGSLEPGKNLALLRQVYELAAGRGIPLPPLVIVGARWAGVPGEGVPPDNWHYLGRQPDAVLVYLYRRAIALAFPSKYEGFGLPVAEAMALGCPVVCAPVASMPEVGGDAPLYAPLEPELWLRALVELARNDRRRQECIKAGIVQSRAFTWRQCAEKTIAVYEQVISKR